MTHQRIGFVGLGRMGAAMSARLRDSGYQLEVYDVRQQAVDTLVGMGAFAAESCKQIAERCDVIISSLPTPESVEQAALGQNGVVEGLSGGKTYIEMSTVDPDTTRRVGAAVASKGAHMLDVPVGKGPAAAAIGDLTLMIGGDEGVVENCKEILNALGSEQFYCGTLGMGVTAKIVNNLVSCSISVLLGEAFTLGTAAGLEAGLLRQVMINTAADTWHARNTFNERVLVRNFEPRFRLSLAHKDLGLASRLAGSLGSPSIVGSAAYEILTLAMRKGLGNEDQSASVKVAEEIAGVEVRGSSSQSKASS